MQSTCEGNAQLAPLSPAAIEHRIEDIAKLLHDGANCTARIEADHLLHDLITRGVAAPPTRPVIEPARDIPSPIRTADDDDPPDFVLWEELELEQARRRHGPVASFVEGMTVIREELDEFKAEVWKGREARDRPAMHRELIQVAAMCRRTAEDVAPGCPAFADLAAASVRDGRSTHPEPVRSAHEGHGLLMLAYGDLFAAVRRSDRIGRLSALVALASLARRTAEDLGLDGEGESR